MLRITAESKECSGLAINFNWQSRSQCQCIRPLMSDFFLVTLVQQMNSSISAPQNWIALKCSYPGQEFIRFLRSLVPRLHSAFRCLHYQADLPTHPLFSGDTRILQGSPAHPHRIASHLDLARLYERCTKRRAFPLIQSATGS